MLLKIGIDIRRKCFSSIHTVFGGKLQYIISGGAAINENLIKEFRTWGVEILNAYGITECSPGVAVNRNLYHKDGTAGLLLPETNVMIANDGEVLVAGGHVMKGYYKDEEATKNAFYREYYKTGDLGYLDDDGFLVITGRKKNLIILSNGENISPEELEQDLLKDVAVNEVLVFEMNGKIVAEIYPEEEYLDNNEYFNLLVKQVNSNRPVYKQINEIKLRDVEFEKNTSKKIVRHKNIKRD